MKIKNKLGFSLLLAAAIFLASFQLSYGVAITDSYHNIKINTPRVSGIFGDKMTASGNVVVTSPELTLKAGTVTWTFDAAGNIKTMEATGNVTFHLVTAGQTGGTLTADGEGDKLVYIPGDNKVTVTVAPGKKAHIHSVEQLPLPAGAAPGQARPTRNYDVKATSISLNLKTRDFDAEGDVELNAALPEKAAPVSEPQKP